ncbi:MAG: hypothetical protein WC551_13250 [Patescibacteria group bacterium]
MTVKPELSDLFETDDMYSEAIDLWGKRVQTAIAFEEFGEYISALGRLERYDETPERLAALVDETADVLIMLEQVAQMHKITRDQIAAKYAEKRAQLSKRISEG